MTTPYTPAHFRVRALATEMIHWTYVYGQLQTELSERIDAGDHSKDSQLRHDLNVAVLKIHQLNGQIGETWRKP